MGRSTTAADDEQWAAWATDVNLDGLHARCHPGDGGDSEDGANRDRYWILNGGQGRGHSGRARRVERGETDVGLEGIGPRGGQIPYVKSRRCRGVGYRGLHTRIAHDKVLSNEISRISRKEQYPVGIADNDVVFDDVVGGGGTARRTDAEVIAWS